MTHRIGGHTGRRAAVRDSLGTHRIAETLASLGGVAQLSALVTAGFAPRTIQRLASQGFS